MSLFEDSAPDSPPAHDSIESVVDLRSEAHDTANALLSDGGALNFEIASALRAYENNGVSRHPHAPFETLGHFINKITKHSTHAMKGAAAIGRAFVLEMFADIRHSICGKGRTPRPLSTNAQTAVAVLAAAIARKLGITEPTSTGIAVLVLLTIAKASKKAFCRITDSKRFDEILGPFLST